MFLVGSLAVGTLSMSMLSTYEVVACSSMSQRVIINQNVIIVARDKVSDADPALHLAAPGAHCKPW